MATAKESSEFMSTFVRLFKEKYGFNVRLNRNTAKWAARDIIDSFGTQDCLKALDWAFKVSVEPFSWEWYIRNVERLLKASEYHQADELARQQRRAKSKEWLSS